MNKIRNKKAKIILTPIGGQGFILGRGNQQISARVVKKVGLENIIIISTKNKLSGFQRLRVDTNDQKLDDLIRSNRLKVITDYGIEVLLKIE